MTDEHGQDDLNHLENEGGDDFTPPKRGIGASIAEAWRTKPLVKLLIIGVSLAAIVAVATSFITPEKPNPAQARVVSPPDIHQAPGGKVSPYMMRQTDMANKSRSDEALKSGGSALPTPQGQVTDLGELEQKQDPLSELKIETQHLKDELTQVKQVQKQQQILVPPQQAHPENADDNLGAAMQHELSQFSDNSWKVHGMHLILVSDANQPLPGLAGSTAANGANANGASPDGTTAADSPPAKALIQAGSVSYAQLLIAASSDVPGPVMAQIVSGPLAGARIIGAFNVQNELLALHFTGMNLKHKDYTINAYAIDPDTTLPGMATDVDHRYFTRVVLPAAAAFLQGVGNSLGQPPQTVVDNGQQTLVTQSQAGFKDGLYEGLGKAATTAGEFFDNQANQTHVLVAIASGTPMGIFFMNTVLDDNAKNLSTLRDQKALATNDPSAFGSSMPAVTNLGGQQANSSPYPSPQGNPVNSGYSSLVPTNTTGYGGGYGASPYGASYGR